MAAAHDLCQDLDISGEEMHQRRKADPELDKLVAEYEKTDRRTLDAEKTTAAIINDEELNALKATRLQLKDKIAQRIQNSGSSVSPEKSHDGSS